VNNLSNGELCNLSEIFLDKIDTIQAFKTCLKYCFFYCKIVSMIPTNIPEVDEIVQKNRRIGVSLSGIHEFVCKYDIPKLVQFLDEGYKFLREYDKKLSKQLGINESIKVSCIEPSGTKSNMFGVFGSSINRPFFRHFIRRVRIQEDDPLVKQYEDMGYEIEKDVLAPNTKIISFPMKVPDYIKLHTDDDEGFLYDLKMLMILQKYYADMSVSHTIFLPKDMTVDKFYDIVKEYAPHLKTLCCCPKSNKVYPQMPIEAITEDKYNEMSQKIKDHDIKDESKNINQYFGCTGDHCDKSFGEILPLTY
jgi:ribonucleoside-diphosphate reductase alpha chain/ribonucleoside-triphosphate reductase